MYCGQWLLIGTDNRRIRICRSLDALRVGLRDGSAATAAARLVDGLCAADIDTEDPIFGDAVAEALVAWCVDRGLPYLVRESGRPGGRHVITALNRTGIGPAEWHTLCNDLAVAYGVTVDDRTGKALRLITAAHRLGLPSRVISCSLTPRDVIDARSLYIGAPAARGSRAARSGGVAPPKGSRSESEFGIVCVLARRDYTAGEAWAEVMQQLDDSAKCIERGRDWWLRYVWLIAVTIVAAEKGHTPGQAWALVERDQLTACGREWWNGLWAIAQNAAADPDRPRRTTLPWELSPTALDSADPGEAEIWRRGLHRAVDDALRSLDPRRRRSVLIVLCALVPALLVRDGAMSMRHIAERGRISGSTVQTAIATAISHGLLTITQRYAGGARSCDSYALGEAAAAHVREASASSPHTSCSTPAPTGHACPIRLRALHARERAAWAPRCDLLASLAPGERLATSQHPVAKLLRSRWAQRKWWQNLTPEQQLEHTQNRRHVLDRLHRTTRSRWFTWLSERTDITTAADRFAAGAAVGTDETLIAAAPNVYHRGLHDRSWAAPSSTGQLSMVA